MNPIINFADDQKSQNLSFERKIPGNADFETLKPQLPHFAPLFSLFTESDLTVPHLSRINDDRMNFCLCQMMCCVCTCMCCGATPFGVKGRKT